MLVSGRVPLIVLAEPGGLYYMLPTYHPLPGITVFLEVERWIMATLDLRTKWHTKKHINSIRDGKSKSINPIPTKSKRFFFGTLESLNKSYSLDIQGHILRRYDWTPKTYHPNTKPHLRRYSPGCLGIELNSKNISLSSLLRPQAFTPHFSTKKTSECMGIFSYPLGFTNIVGWNIPIFNRIHTSTQSGALIFQQPLCKLIPECSWASDFPMPL